MKQIRTEHGLLESKSIGFLKRIHRQLIGRVGLMSIEHAKLAAGHAAACAAAGAQLVEEVFGRGGTGDGADARFCRGAAHLALRLLLKVVPLRVEIKVPAVHLVSLYLSI